MLNTPWDTGSPLYRRLVMAALALTGLGILIAVIGAVISSTPVVYAGIPVIIAGMLVHIAGLVVRTRDARRRQQSRTGRK